MRIVLFCNNWAGWQAFKWLLAQGEEVVGLVVHPEGSARCRGEILAEARRRPGIAVLDGSRLDREETVRSLAGLRPDIGLSVYFGYILKPEVLSLFPLEVLNLHPSYLPYNRGAHPNVWSIVEETPAGVTLHYVDAGIDTGDIVAQREVPVAPSDTGGSLYRKLERAGLELLQEAWPHIKAGRVRRQPQPRDRGTFHRVAQLRELDRIDLDKEYRARDLINLLRARTFPPYKGAYFEDQGRRVYIRLELEEEQSGGDG